MNQKQLDDATAPRSVDQQQACSPTCGHKNPHTHLLVCDLQAGHEGDHTGAACLYPEHEDPITRHWWSSANNPEQKQN